jgi:hypothetical protein
MVTVADRFSIEIEGALRVGVTGAVSILAVAHVYRQLEGSPGREAGPRDGSSVTP